MPRDELRAWVHRRIREGKPGERFPPDGELAERFQVGIVAVKAILKELKEEGLLVRVRNRGTFLPTIAEPQPRAPVQDAAGRLAATLRTQFARGLLTFGEYVPKADFLCAKYGVSPRTVSAAMRRLLQEGIVHRAGRSYQLTSPPRQGGGRVGRPQVWLVADTATGNLFSRGNFAPVLQSLELELLRWGCLFRLHPCGDAHELFSELRTVRNPPAGLVVWGDYDRAALGTLLPVIESSFKRMKSRSPRTILDCYRNYHFAGVPGLALFARQELISGSAKEMVRYLTAGRRRPLFCYPAQSSRYRSWAAMRYEALVDAVKNTGGSCDIVCISEQASAGPEEVRVANGGFAGYRFTGNDCRRALMLSPLFGRCLEQRGAQTWVCANDALAADALCWLTLKGIRVPRDIEIVGFDHHPDFFPLGLTSYDPDYRRLGYLMAHYIMGDIPVYTRGNAVSCVGWVCEKLTTR